MPTAVADAPSVRMQRMLLILKKALDVSVHGASAVDLRACVAAESRGDAALLARVFPDAADADELAAQAVLSLRGKMEDMFEWLCEKHDVDEALRALERLVRDAQDAQLRALAERRELEAAAERQRQEQQQQTQTQTQGLDGAPEVAPDKLVRAERVRVLEEERRQLEALADELEAANRRLQGDVEARRAAAAADVERLQQLAAQLDGVNGLARDHSTAP